MTRRPDRWWMRWYVIQFMPGSTLFDIDPDEFIQCATATRWGARRIIGNDPNLRAVRRISWWVEH